MILHVCPTYGPTLNNKPRKNRFLTCVFGKESTNGQPSKYAVHYKKKLRS